MVTTGAPEIVGYFTQKVQKDGRVEVLQPKWKYPNKVEIRKINNGTPLQYNKEKVLPARYSTSADALLRFLNDRSLLKARKQLEYNVVCRASCLYHILYRADDKDHGRKFRMEQRKSGAVTLEEDVAVTTPMEVRAIGQWVEDTLTRLARSQKLQLYVVVKHVFYRNGIAINLFVSKEIDSILPGTLPSEVKTAIDWKVFNYYMYNTTTRIQHFSVKNMIMDFLAGGITYVYGLRKTHDKVERVTVMEEISRVCESLELVSFKKMLGPLLFNICGMDTTNTLIRCHKKGVFWITEKGKRRTLSLVVEYPIEQLDRVPYDPDYHVLVILGKYAKPIHYHRKYCFSDFITLDSLVTKKYEGMLRKATQIILYGTRDDLNKAKRMISGRIELIEDKPHPVVVASVFKYFTDYFLDKYQTWLKKFNQD